MRTDRMREPAGRMQVKIYCIPEHDTHIYTYIHIYASSELNLCLRDYCLAALGNYMRSTKVVKRSDIYCHSKVGTDWHGGKVKISWYISFPSCHWQLTSTLSYQVVPPCIVVILIRKILKSPKYSHEFLLQVLT